MIGHPAVYSKAVLECFEREIPLRTRVLDPFAGTGKIHDLTRRETFGIELEPEWAQMRPGTIVGNALQLPFADESFDVIATSPVYGNRMSDHHDAKDPCKQCKGHGSVQYAPVREDDAVTCRLCKGTGLSMRKTYKHQLGRDPSPGSAAVMQWSVEYRTFHINAWNEAVRVLRDGGLFFLNVSNHIRKGAEVPVTEWHIDVLHDLLGLKQQASWEIKTPRMRVGSNSDVRTAHEYVIKLVKR